MLSARNLLFSRSLSSTPSLARSSLSVSACQRSSIAFTAPSRAYSHAQSPSYSIPLPFRSSFSIRRFPFRISHSRSSWSFHSLKFAGQILATVSIASIAGYSLSYIIESAQTQSRSGGGLIPSFLSSPRGSSSSGPGSSPNSPANPTALLSSSPLDSILPDWNRLSNPVRAILLAHGAVFLLSRLQVSHRFIMTHFTCSLDGVFRQKRFYTLWTSLFTHITPFHLLFNSLALASFSSQVTPLLTDTQFIAFYSIAGILSSLLNNAAIYWAARGRNQLSYLTIPQLGASGAVYAVVTLAANLYPDMQLGIFFIPISLGAVSFIQLMAVAETIGCVASRYRGLSGWGHGAHLGGIICGWAAYEFLSRYHKGVATFVKWKQWKQRFQVKGR